MPTTKRKTASPKKTLARATATPIRINVPTLNKGERYAGLLLKNGKVNGGHHLILLPQQGEKLTFDQANAWAKTQGATLPDRRESRLLFANQPEAFHPAIYWTSEPYAGTDAVAWGQTFNDGYQDGWLKYAAFRCCAVRRVVI